MLRFFSSGGRSEKQPPQQQQQQQQRQHPPLQHYQQPEYQYQHYYQQMQFQSESEPQAQPQHQPEPTYGYGTFLYQTADVYVGQYVGPRPDKQPRIRQSTAGWLGNPLTYAQPPPIGKGSPCVALVNSDEEHAELPDFSRQRDGCQYPHPAPCRQGWGVLLKAKRKYFGQWHNDEEHGVGIMFGDGSGGRFSGTFFSGEKQKGILLTAEGSLFYERRIAGQLVTNKQIFACPEAMQEDRDCKVRTRGQRCTHQAEGNEKKAVPTATPTTSPSDPKANPTFAATMLPPLPSPKTNRNLDPDADTDTDSSLSSSTCSCSSAARSVGSGRRRIYVSRRMRTEQERQRRRRYPSNWNVPQKAKKTLGVDFDGSSDSSDAHSDGDSSSGADTDDMVRHTGEELSHVSAMDYWKPEQVSMVLRAIGINEAATQKLRCERVDGRSLPRLVSRGGQELLAEIFGDPAKGTRLYAEKQQLLLTIQQCIRLRNRLGFPMLENEIVGPFSELDIPSAELTHRELLGQGAYGAVHRANWRNGEVAAKSFQNDQGNNLPKSFYAELEVMCHLRHPNVAMLIGISNSDYYTIVSEYVAGGCLYQILHTSRRETFEWNMSCMVEVSRQVALGMYYLHKHNIVHCDLKSSNILVDYTNQVKICDFGLARSLHLENDCDDGIEEAKVAIGVVGTYHWTAPEVLRGEDYTKASDVYSFGMVGWEMASGKVPFANYTYAQVVGLIGYGGIVPAMPDGCPAQMRNFLGKALRPKPLQRETFDKLAQDLAQLRRSPTIDIESGLWLFFAGRLVGHKDDDLGFCHS